jgi:hypothetical protein
MAIFERAKLRAILFHGWSVAPTMTGPVSGS